MHRLVTLIVTLMQRSPTKLKSQANLYWFLTNWAGQSSAITGAPSQARSEQMPATKTSRPEKVMSRKTHRGFAARREAPGLAADLADVVHSLVRGLFDPY